MSSPFEALKLLGLSIAFYSVAGCGGELIRLGDSNAGSSALGGTAGAADKLANAGSGMSAVGGAGSCQHATVPANEVVWIGDSWLNYPAGAPQCAFVQDQARLIMAIGPNDEIRAVPERGRDRRDGRTHRLRPRPAAGDHSRRR
jgi:hypothetical protein